MNFDFVGEISYAKADANFVIKPAQERRWRKLAELFKTIPDLIEKIVEARKARKEAKKEEK